MDDASAYIRNCFDAAAQVFVGLVGAVPVSQLDNPGLGIWTVRDLIGHTSRALITIESYIGKVSTNGNIEGAIAYFVAVRNTTIHPNEIAQRGIDAGKALGDNPASAVSEIANRVSRLVTSTSDKENLGTPWGNITFIEYLRTRSFELTVHSLDIARAAGLIPPPELNTPILDACELAGLLAAHHPRSTEILLALTGRSTLPEDIKVV